MNSSTSDCNQSVITEISCNQHALSSDAVSSWFTGSSSFTSPFYVYNEIDAYRNHINICTKRYITYIYMLKNSMLNTDVDISRSV